MSGEPLGRHRLAFSLVAAVALAACSPHGDASLTEKAEAAAAAEQPAGFGELPFDLTRVKPLRACSLAAVSDAIASIDPARRAAAALCAIELPCREPELDAWLSRLALDPAIASEYTNRGPIMGSGDQTVSTPVSAFAQFAIERRRAVCPAPS